MKVNLKKYLDKELILIFLSAVYIVTFLNNAFWGEFLKVFEIGSSNFIFILSLYINLILIISFILYILTIFIPTKLTLILFIILSTFNSYFSDNFKTMIDIHMVRNIVETNFNESKDLLNFNFIFTIFLKGIVPSFLLFKFLKIKKYSLLKLKSKLVLATSCLVLIFPIMSLSSKHFAYFFRQHKAIRQYINPIFPLYSTGKYISKNLIPKEKKVFELITKEVKRLDDDSAPKELVILVVGETARADHFSLNGYQKETNPLLQKYSKQLVSYQNAYSCGTSTAYSVPCMFSYFPKSKFDIDEFHHTENVLDSLRKTKVDILWRDNNSDSKGVANRVEYQNFKNHKSNKHCDDECRDIGMLDGLDDYIKSKPGDILIILHQMGSHGPAYFKRYPKEFEVFLPTCKTSNLSECTKEEISNTYDNTILYTDYFLSKVIEFLKTKEQNYQTTMIYMSDHGESLGENNIYLHAMPYAIAPDSQIHIPFIIWTSDNSDLDMEQTKQLNDLSTSHDVLSHFLIDIFEIGVKHDIKKPKIPIIFKND